MCELEERNLELERTQRQWQAQQEILRRAEEARREKMKIEDDARRQERRRIEALEARRRIDQIKLMETACKHYMEVMKKATSFNPSFCPRRVLSLCFRPLV